jgi:phosphoglycolate phosphatase-like HAD superfamily hydrolase
MNGSIRLVPEPTAVLFDFDGVLVESADIKTAAFRLLYREYGEAVVAAAVAHHMANGGISRRQKIRHCHRTLLGIELCTDRLDALCHRFSALVEDQVVAAPMVPGAAEAVARLAARVPLFIVSGTPHAELVRIVARRGLARPFTGIHGSPPEKPPIIREILARHGLHAASSWFIGDAMTDHDAARDCGLPFIGRIGRDGWNPFPPGTRLIRDLTELAT